MSKMMVNWIMPGSYFCVACRHFGIFFCPMSARQSEQSHFLCRLRGMTGTCITFFRRASARLSSRHSFFYIFKYIFLWHTPTCNMFSREHFVLVFSHSNNLFFTKKIGLKLQTNVYNSMCGGYTKGGLSKLIHIWVIVPFLSKKNFLTKWR